MEGVLATLYNAPLTISNFHKSWVNYDMANALAASDNVIIPVQAQYLSTKGLEQLLQTINKVRRQINPKLKIEGILLTMVDSRTNYAKDITYENVIDVLKTIVM